MSEAVSQESDPNIEKTPPREDIVRTPPRSATERPYNLEDPVVTPTKCEIEHGEERMVDVSEGLVEVLEEDLEGTQQVPDPPTFTAGGT